MKKYRVTYLTPLQAKNHTYLHSEEIEAAILYFENECYTFTASIGLHGDNIIASFPIQSVSIMLIKD